MSQCFVYRATEQNNANSTEAEYIGITHLTFKTSYNNSNIHSLRNEAQKHSTGLSTYVWADNLNPNPNIK